jgi:flagellar biogenesis protein FliO
VGFEIVYGLGAALLLVALIWGTMRFRDRRRGERKVGDSATDRLYKRSGDPEA